MRLGRPKPVLRQPGQQALKKDWWKDLPGVLLNSGLIAGIASLGMVADAGQVAWRAVGITGGLVFLAELRKFLDLQKR